MLIDEFLDRSGQPYLDLWVALGQNRCRLRRMLTHVITAWDLLQADASLVDTDLAAAASELSLTDQMLEFSLSTWVYHKKLWSVHLNDQNGLKYDQDKVFGSADLRRAFDQVWTLEKNGYGRDGECIGLDVKAMRTTVFEESMFHLAHSKTMFLRLLDIVRGVDEARVEELRQARQYEQLEMLILNALTGRKD